MEQIDKSIEVLGLNWTYTSWSRDRSKKLFIKIYHGEKETVIGDT